MRIVDLSRDQAELLVDLLDVSDHPLAADTNDLIRRAFGMKPILPDPSAGELVLVAELKKVFDSARVKN